MYRLKKGVSSVRFELSRFGRFDSVLC